MTKKTIFDMSRGLGMDTDFLRTLREELSRRHGGTMSDLVAQFKEPEPLDGPFPISPKSEEHEIAILSNVRLIEAMHKIDPELAGKIEKVMEKVP